MRRLALALFAAAAPLALPVVTPVALADAALAPEVSLDELKAAVETKKAVIIDANGDQMYKDGHVPGALHFAKIEKSLESALPKDKSTLIVAYCGGPMCTAWQDAAKALKAKNYTNVKHFKGGIKGWKEAGQPVEKG